MNLLHRVYVAAFDFFKKRNMEKHYQHEHVWGREKPPHDVDALFARVAGKKFNRCLDLGTGMGHYAEQAARICQQVVAYDISERAIQRAKQRLAQVKNIEFKVGNLRTIQPAETFDLIILGDVLYYLGDTRFPDAFADVIKRVVSLAAPGGTILISNYISPSRTEEQLRGYTTLFVAAGATRVSEDIFTDHNRSYLQTVLTT